LIAIVTAQRESLSLLTEYSDVSLNCQGFLRAKNAHIGDFANSESLESYSIQVVAHFDGEEGLALKSRISKPSDLPIYVTGLNELLPVSI